VRHGGTVRNSQGDVVQFLYGEDGMDAVRIEEQNVEYLRWKVRCVSRLLSNVMTSPEHTGLPCRMRKSSPSTSSTSTLTGLDPAISTRTRGDDCAPIQRHWVCWKMRCPRFGGTVCPFRTTCAGEVMSACVSP
jgi:hypothetical protein